MVAEEHESTPATKPAAGEGGKKAKDPEAAAKARKARTELAQARRKPPESLDTYDCVLRVYDYLQTHSPDKHLAARDCLEMVVVEVE